MVDDSGLKIVSDLLKNIVNHGGYRSTRANLFQSFEKRQISTREN